MSSKRPRRPLLARTLTSLAAIIAVSTIFGAKALELERRHAATAQTVAMAPASPAGAAD